MRPVDADITGTLNVLPVNLNVAGEEGTGAAHRPAAVVAGSIFRSYAAYQLLSIKEDMANMESER